MKGKIGVTTENIFPVIKQFLYSDHEIFLRELVANAVDATEKMKALASSGDFKGVLGDLFVKIELDEDKKELRIIDRGIGMTEEEVDKYINQIAFSSAGEFLEKYKDQIGNIIGHFGLGFYSAFMVSKKVTIETLSWKDGAKAVKWSCDGSPEYEMGECDKTDRGTVITLYLDDDSTEYASTGKSNSSSVNTVSSCRSRSCSARSRSGRTENMLIRTRTRSSTAWSLSGHASRLT